MSLTASELWERMRDQGILSPNKLASLQEKIALRADVANSPERIVRLLIANRLLTTEQGRELLESPSPDIHPGPTGHADHDCRPNNPQEPLSLAYASTSVPPSRRSVSSSRTSPIALGGLLLAVLLVVGGVLYLSPFQRLGENFGNDIPSDLTERSDPRGASTTDPDQSPLTEFSSENMPGYQTEWTSEPDTLWGRAELGAPIPVNYLSPRTQAVVFLRMAGHAGTETVGRELLPILESYWQRLDLWLSPLELTHEDVQELTIGWSSRDNSVESTGMVRLRPGKTGPIVADRSENSRSNLGAPTPNPPGLHVWKDGAVWYPDVRTPNLFVWGSVPMVSEIARGERIEEIPWRRELAQLHQFTHDTDQLAIILAPHFLGGEGGKWLAGTERLFWDRLREFWSDETQGVSWGMQVGEVTLLEFRMAPRAEQSAPRLRAHVQRELDRLATQVSDYLSTLSLDPYWQRLALRFPTMLGTLVDQTRTAVEEQQVVVTSVLPKAGVSNLWVATELTLASSANSELKPTIKKPGVDAGDIKTIDELLARPFRFSFPQLSLDAAMKDLQSLVREEYPSLPHPFEIQVIGGDLERDGITRNQQIREFQHAESLAELLTRLVVKANPERAEAPTDSKQKLVWVIDSTAPFRITITTRTAAMAGRGALPIPFRVP